MNIASSYKSYRSNQSESHAELDDDQLLKEVKEMKDEIRILRLENEILERTILHYDPLLMHGVHHALDYAMKMRSMTGSGSVVSYAKSAISSKVTASVSKYSSAKLSGHYILAGPRINVNAKIELVVSETKTLSLEQEKAKKMIAKKHDLLIAQLEQCDVLVEKTNHDSEHFIKEVVNGSWDDIAQRIPAEAWVRYIKEWFKAAEIQTTKIRLKISNLNTQFRKLKNITKVKAELHESLTPVDFKKLKIENAVSTKIIDEKTTQIKSLKQMVCFANNNLRKHKVAMAKQQAYLCKVNERKDATRNMERKLKKEISSIQVETTTIEKELKKIGALRQKFHAISLIDYVKIQSELAELRSSIKRLSNRELILRLTSQAVPWVKRFQENSSIDEFS